MRKDEDLPSPVRLKKLLPTPVVSKRLTVENEADTEMESQLVACRNNVPLGPANANGVTNVTRIMELTRCILLPINCFADSREE